MSGCQGTLAGDLAQDMEGDSGVGLPGESGVAEVVAAQVLVAQLGDHLVPVGRVAQDRGGDASCARAGEHARVGVGAGGEDALCHERSDRFDDGTFRARLPWVPLSVGPPGAGVVWRRTVQIHWFVSMSPTRHPETSAMRAAVLAAKSTTSPQPRYWS